MKRSKDADLSIEYLRSILAYDPQTGAITWKLRDPRSMSFQTETALNAFMLWNEKHAFKPAGTITKSGSVRVMILKGLRLGHNLAWALHYGVWPDQPVWHRNFDKSDNRIVNLSKGPITKISSVRVQRIINDRTKGETVTHDHH